ncbi:MAG: Eco57I restriction-modification methylase domain-containing protein [Solirubrobacterales bacterium]
MAKIDPEVLAHLEWLGFVQPTGLVVSAPALVRAGAILDRRDAAGQELLRSALDPDAPDDRPAIADFEQFARDVLGWQFSPKGYAGTDENPIPDELQVVLPDYEETLVPDFAVRELNPAEGAPAWQLLVSAYPTGTDLDAISSERGGLEASPHGRMERLLRETGVTAGLLFDGHALRLVSAPRGESSGWLQFDVAAIAQTAGRPICTAMRVLLGQQRLLTLPKEKRLAALLDDSRRFQNEVSEKLAEQVLHALYELLRGFQAAHDASDGNLLRDPLDRKPDEVYHGLLTVILRLVFLLYAEERDMLPIEDETFGRSYSLAGLFSRLRDHASHFPDTMDQRYGAWAQLLVLFRMVHDGATAGEMQLPARHGGLFDPDRYPFLEGRPAIGTRQNGERIEPPLVPDGTIFRSLEKLLVLDGERLSYRALDVEQIGSIYQTMMGFRLETATGRSLAIRAVKRLGAPTTIDLDQLAEVEPGKRDKWIKDAADRDLPAKVKAAVKDATSIEELHGALAPVMDRNASPDLLPLGAMVLQPSDERRKSGSHYTPRALTEPIVRTTLKPLLDALRDDEKPPTSDQILDLKICDPAMGSAAFLVEACRQLGDELIESWAIHGNRPGIPADEDEVVFARRLVAQRCLYGLDRNPVAVDLAKMSLWLATLAREHALTFLDHALRSGDALVGLSSRQVQAFHWDDTAPPLAPVKIKQHLDRVTELRGTIREADEDVSDFQLRDMWDEAQHELEQVRLYGDLAILAFFGGDKKKAREAKRAEFLGAVTAGEVGRFGGLVDEARRASPPLVPFHWQIEFPEVFQRESPGFDAFVGNPPFAGKNTLLAGSPAGILDWLKHIHEGAHGNADLVAHFFRRAFGLLRPGGTFGLIATNTIRQGDTRATGLRWICTHGGEMYEARRRVRWPGTQAAVIVAVVHVTKGAWGGPRLLDGREVETITAFLFHAGGHDDPARLKANAGKSFQGSIVLGMGFTFDDTDKKGIATPIAEMHRLLVERPENSEVIFPYIGGEEVNGSPTHSPHRYVINFGERPEEECRRRWPELLALVEEKVRPERLTQNDGGAKEKWWQFIRPRQELHVAVADLDRVLVTNCGATPHLAIAWQSSGRVFANTLAVFALESDAALATLQSRPHEVWARFFGSSMKDDLRYTPSDCFETFSFPEDWGSLPALEEVGRVYNEHRAQLMVADEEGLTRTYNRFHDPEEASPAIVELRQLQEAMDRAVLDAYGWADIPTDCEFLLDYEVDDEERSSRRKKPWRYRWPDDVHDEVLARLLALNAKRAAEEQRSGAADAVAKAKPAAKLSRSEGNTESLF